MTELLRLFFSVGTECYFLVVMRPEREVYSLSLHRAEIRNSSTYALSSLDLRHSDCKFLVTFLMEGYNEACLENFIKVHVLPYRLLFRVNVYPLCICIPLGSCTRTKYNQ